MTEVSTKVDQTSVSSNYLIEETNSQPLNQFFGCDNAQEYDDFCRYLATGYLSPVLVQKLQVSEAVKDKPKLGGTYLVTFTRDPSVTIVNWWKQLLRALRLHSYKAATIEHADSNIHCHAIIESKVNLSKDRYKAFKSRIDFRKISTDNGVEEYLSKENGCFYTVEEFIHYFEKLLFEKK